MTFSDFIVLFSLILAVILCGTVNPSVFHTEGEFISVRLSPGELLPVPQLQQPVEQQQDHGSDQRHQQQRHLQVRTPAGPPGRAAAPRGLRGPLRPPDGAGADPAGQRRNLEGGAAGDQLAEAHRCQGGSQTGSDVVWLELHRFSQI